MKDPLGAQLTQLSPIDGHVLATIVEQEGPHLSPFHPLLAWPDGDAMFHVSDDGRLWRIETSTGDVSVTPLTGFPSSAIAVGAPVMMGPATILVSVLRWYNSAPQGNDILSIDISTATATVIGTVPPERTVHGIDPQGQFVVLDTGTMPLGSSGVMPSFSGASSLMTGPRGALLMASGSGIQLWDRSSATSVQWAGLDLPSSLAITGPGDALIFQDAPLAIAAAGDRAYVTWALPGDGLAVVDLATNAVSVWTQANALNAAAVLPLADGTLYVTERADCSVWQLGTDPGATPIALSPAMGTCLTTGMNDTVHYNWVTSGLALFDGSLLMVSTGVDGIVQIDPVQGTWSSHAFYDPDGAGEPHGIQFSGAAVGSDGLLYVVDARKLYRIDHGLNTATVVGEGAFSVAADTAGHVFTTDADSVLRYDIATGHTLRVVGVPGSAGVVPGALPASLNQPRGLAVTAGGDLLIGNVAEYVVLRARFQ